MQMQKKFQRTVSCLVAGALLLGCVPTAGLSAWAAEIPEDRVIAQYGSPVLDGSVDEVWSQAVAYELTQPSTLEGTTGEVRLLWDENALYLLAEIADDTPDASSATTYMQDSVEAFLDELNDGGSSYGSDDVHYRVSYLGAESVDGGEDERWITACSVLEDGSGYLVEAAVTWSAVEPENGTVCGFDVQVNACADGSRTGTVSLFDASGNAWQNPSMFGTLELAGREDGDTAGVFPYRLQSAIETAEAMNLSVYTEESAAVLLDAIAAGKALLETEGYTQEEVDAAEAEITRAIRALDDGSGMTSPYDLPEQTEIPDLLTFENGKAVTSAEDWEARTEELRQLLSYYEYGPMPDATEETVTYTLGELTTTTETVTMPDGTEGEVTVRTGSMTVQIAVGEASSSFDTVVVLPTTEAPEAGYPVYSEMAFAWGGSVSPSSNAYYAASRGYASITWSPTDVAADDSSRTGAFYTVHPYGDAWTEQTGVLMAWAWGAGKVLDALENGAGNELNIDPENNILGGVSRYGKATAVAGAFDERIKVCVPACSGAGGMAMYRYLSQGKTYDLAELGYVNDDGTSYLTTSSNERLSNLQSNDAYYWFNENYRKLTSAEQLPLDQHYLAALVASEDRYLFMVNGVDGEDWTNPAAMSLTYAAAKEAFDLLGVGDHICLSVHLKGHSINLSDMVYLLDYCDVYLYGKDASEVSSDLREVRTSVYLDDVNYDAEVFDAYVGTNLTDIVREDVTEQTIEVVNGTDQEALAAMLPQTVKIYVDDIRHMNAAISWDVASSGYDAQTRTEQTLQISGQIVLPDGIENPDGLDLTLTVSVTVKAWEPAVSVPYTTGAIADGEALENWSDSEALAVDNALDESGDAETATLRLLYDEAYLYLYVNASDSDVYIDGDNDEQEDSITLTIARDGNAGKEVNNYVFTAGGAALKASWDTSSYVAVQAYTLTEDAWCTAALTEQGWALEGCIAWSALGIDPTTDEGFALEAVLNCCGSESAGQNGRKAIALTEYPTNEESYTWWWFNVSYNAGLYANNLCPFVFGENTGETPAENIGRYELLLYIAGFEETYVTPYPVQDAYDAALLEEARTYALSAEATKEGIAAWRERLEAMAEQLLADNCYGKLMTKYGTPIVDGEKDALWENAYAYHTSSSADGQYADIRTLWDSEALYMLVEVHDPTYDVTGSDAHTKDSVEFFFIESEDAAQNSYGKNGGQWRINRAGVTTVTFGMNEPFYARVTELEDGSGYLVEARIAFADDMTITADTVMNFDVAVNLCENGDRTEAVAWTSTDCYSNPNTAGELIYLAESAGTSAYPDGYDPYQLLKLLDKALLMEREDYDTESFDASYDQEKLERYRQEALGGNLSDAELETYYQDVISMMSAITYDGVHSSVLGFEADHTFPDTFTSADGTSVTAAEDWEARREEILDLYEFYMYGALPDAEETGLEKQFSVSEDGSTYTITLTRGDVEASFTFQAYLPEGEAPEGGWPYIINYGNNIEGAQEAGYAVIDYSTNGDVAANNSYYQGVFYDLYPECRGDNAVTGVGPLAARAWGAGLIIDCIESGIGQLSTLDPAKSAVSGFSYLGKTALVTGALEERIAVTNAAHSGIAGAALLRYSSQGKYYSTEEYPLFEEDFLTTKTEPIGQAQGQGMAWVKSIFADFIGSDTTPFDTYMLLSLVAPRGLFLSAGYYDNGTDPEGMYGSYLGARQVYQLLGVEGNIAFGDYPTAHTTSTEETQDFLAFLDYYFYGTELDEDFYQTVYDESPDRAEYDVIRIPDADLTELKAAVAQAEGLVEADYTAESYQAVVALLEQAKALTDADARGERVSQRKVNERQEALLAALEALVSVNPNQTDPTNPTNPTNPGKTTNPNTGDETQLLPLVLLAAASAAGLIALLVWRRRKS